jgi:GntR family transcriptional regulator, transcriptional repressor for pyruvate dehydrogenase complex
MSADKPTVSNPVTRRTQNNKRRKRPDIAAECLRELIIGHDLQPGDRVPVDWLREDALKVSRGTLREALKLLEFQGLIVSRTGPGGGVFVSAISPDHAIGLLDNLFLFEAPSIADIYAIRKLLEPELAAQMAGQLTPDVFEKLQNTVRLYEDEPETAQQEYSQRLAELDFHAELARNCPNRLLGFVCEFLSSLLKDMTICRKIYQDSNPGLRETGLHYQIRLLRALKSGDCDHARQIMHDHMIEAEKYMLERADIRQRARYRDIE